MCGIVGLHLRDRSLEPALGSLLTPMLVAMTSRGPDSAGVAVYTDPVPADSLRYSLRGPEHTEWGLVGDRLALALGVPVHVSPVGNMAFVEVQEAESAVRAELDAAFPELWLVGYGRALKLYKDVGSPTEICDRYGIDTASGYQAVGHTRMATESAVTMAHSHPFAPSADLCLVHNGSFSNYGTQRRRLEDLGCTFETDNDSEVAARYVGYRLSEGDDLEEALRRVLKDFDGFFTLLVSTANEFAVVRDAFACKPLVVAQTDRYVAVASEYHAVASLPGIDQADVFEPMPEEVHAWSR